MTEAPENTSPLTTVGAVTFKNIIPYLFALAAFGYGVWESANSASVLQATQSFQGQEIAQLMTAEKSQQDLSVTIQTELAQITQSLADIKASSAHASN